MTLKFLLQDFPVFLLPVRPTIRRSLEVTSPQLPNGTLPRGSPIANDQRARKQNRSSRAVHAGERLGERIRGSWRPLFTVAGRAQSWVRHVPVQYAILCHVDDDDELRVVTCVHTLRLCASSGSLNEPGGTHDEDDSNDQASERQPTCADPGRESRAYVYIQSPAIMRPGGWVGFFLNQDGIICVTCLPDDPTIRRGMKGKDGAGKGKKNERGGRGGEHEQRAYSRVKSHHSVTIGWSMKRNLWDLLRHFSATSTCRTALVHERLGRKVNAVTAGPFEIPKRQGVRRNACEKKSAL
ncbi:hypothetical protein G5I_09942 [Acromyrmex echinatior]|uniref:Uncharacterized protein n=1 Tax=Acromyrmex echinatior TaxID=103372 RepID=F4WVK2_ACREC|nr:hypothetical protein G5I_09942 [Acromyrmex echinatior]